MNAPSLRELQYFVAVYHAKSFSAAARNLQMSQPPLSQSIATCERTLGVRLFERTTRSVVPTPAADALLPEAEFLLARAAEIPALVSHASVADHPQTHIRMGAVSSVFSMFLTALLPRLRTLRCSVTDHPSAEALFEVAEGRLDIALVRDLNRDDLARQLLLKEQLYVAVPADDELSSQHQCRIKDLDHRYLITFDRSLAPIAFDTIATCFRTADIPMRPISQVHSEQAALGLVSAGMGITIVPEIATRLRQQGVRFLRLTDSPVNYPLWAVTAPNDPLSLLAPVAEASEAARQELGLVYASPSAEPESGG